jgi:hypothetical protein
MNESNQLALFDYSQLSPDICEKAQIASERIKVRMKRTGEDIIEIGKDLIEIKALLPHGQFLPWIESEFEMDQKTAFNFMSVAEKFGDKLGIIPNFKPTILYLLAAPSTPDEVINQVIEKAENGEKITVKEIKELKAELETKDNALIIEEPIEPDNPEVKKLKAEIKAKDIALKQWKEKTEKAEAYAREQGDLLLKSTSESKTDVEANTKQSTNRYTSLTKSSKSDVHPTPDKITNFLYEFFGAEGIDLDPCSDSNFNIKAKKHYTIEDNGLSQPWQGNVFVNPPFSEVAQWAEKAIAEYQDDKIPDLIFLTKFDARVAWFKPLMNNADVFCVVEGYVSFEGNDGDSATFTTVLWYFGTRHWDFASIFSGLGWICRECSGV